jgi:hypothetical protein
MTGFDSHGQVLWCHYCWHWLLWIPCVHLYTGPTLLKYLAGRPGQDGSVGEKNWLFPSLSLPFCAALCTLSSIALRPCSLCMPSPSHPKPCPALCTTRVSLSASMSGPWFEVLWAFLRFFWAFLSRFQLRISSVVAMLACERHLARGSL